MTLEMLCEAVTKIRNGACVRIGYTSQVPVKAKYRNRVKIKKWVTTTGRLGVKYSNIKRVADRLAAQQNKPYKPTNFTWVIPNKIKYHPEKGTYYLNISTFSKGSHTKVLYDVVVDGVTELVLTKDELFAKYKEYILPSFFKEHNCNELDNFIVKAENVFKVGSVTLL